MSSIEVKAVSVPELLKRLKSGEWLAPEFQRDFVWSNSQVVSLVNSVLDAKPIGMATLWAQEKDSDLPLEHISINDWIQEEKKSGPRYFGDRTEKPGLYFAVLDGKQRSTAMAIAFGGLRAENKSYKFAGGYYLNVLTDDPQDRVEYLGKNSIEDKGLLSLSAYVQQGLFPLAMPEPDEMINQWVGYINSIDNKDHYSADSEPTDEEKLRRRDIIQNAFKGLNSTKLAVYIVPKEETLGEICDIFETLNTTGTKVSTVDLIHSWVYAETIDDSRPILLRDEIDSLGELPGTEKWASSKKRPELIAQILACIQMVLDRRHDPRPVSGRKPTKITSIKSSDLLAISSESWKDFFNKKDFVAQCFRDFQEVVAGGRFSLDQCPYPGIVSIYLAMRWYLEFDKTPETFWNITHLNRLFGAFFWRNSFSQRYDQGFLTRIGMDVVDFKSFLNSTKEDQKIDDWAVLAEEWLSSRDRMQSAEFMYKEIFESLKNGHTKGATRSASRLLLLARARKDVYDPKKSILNLTDKLELHHIYPKNWCKNNSNQATKEFVTIDKERNNWVDSPANLMPMHPDTNKAWLAKEPSMALEELDINSQDQLELLRLYFIDKEAQNLLESGGNNIGKFLLRRHELIAAEIKKLMRV